MDIFKRYYQENFWADDESVSGAGSTMEATAAIRKYLPTVFKGMNSLLDIPCGDFNWLRSVQLPQMYIGADVVPELIAENAQKFGDKNTKFRVLDITKDPLPKVDIVMVRDLFGHFSNREVQAALKNIRRSGSRYLLATTFPLHENSGDIETGQWRPLNLGKYWGLPVQDLIINEGCGVPGYSDKSLALWDLGRR